MLPLQKVVVERSRKFYSSLKNSAESKDVSGPDFSRADKVSKMIRDSAPANPSCAGFAFRSEFFRNRLTS